MNLRALGTNEPLEHYLEIKPELERLSDELDRLKPLIAEALPNEPEQRTPFLGCKITLKRYRRRRRR